MKNSQKEYFYTFFPNWENLNFIKLDTDLGIYGLKSLIEESETSIRKINKDLEDYLNQVKDDLSDHDEEYKEYIISQKEDQDSEFKWEFEKRQRAAFVLILFAFFESKLRRICQLIENEFPEFKIKLDDVKQDENIIYYLKYIEKVFGFKIPSNVEKFLTPIKQDKIIRNIIAHQDSIINEKEKNKIEKRDGLKVFFDENKKIGEVIISKKEYLVFLTDNINSFFKIFIKELDQYYGNIK